MEHILLKHNVNEETTVKEILTNKFRVSARLLRKLKLNKRIFCNGKEAWVSDKVGIGDVVTADITFTESNDKIKAQKYALDILYEDNCLLIVNKPADMVVHPTCIHLDGTLANFVKGYLEEKGEIVSTRFVNRLDRETSGVIIFAKNEYTQEALVRQMQSGEFMKEYIAIVYGNIENKSGTINLPIKRAENSIMERVTAADGEYAVTHYEVTKNLDDMSVVRLRLETGRTHQIRVHLKAIGHPIVGDGLYSDIYTDKIKRQALHACAVRFIHPITREIMLIEAKMPFDIKMLINLRDDG